MTSPQSLEAIFEQSLEQFPYPIEPTSITQGNLTFGPDGVEYSAEFTFKVGQLLDDTLTAGGWIELRQDPDDDTPTLSAIFSIVRNFDWKNGSILKEYEGLLGWYDLNTQQWELKIDTY